MKLKASPWGVEIFVSRLGLVLGEKRRSKYSVRVVPLRQVGIVVGAIEFGTGVGINTWVGAKVGACVGNPGVTVGWAVVGNNVGTTGVRVGNLDAAGIVGAGVG